MYDTRLFILIPKGNYRYNGFWSIWSKIVLEERDSIKQ